MAKKIFRKAKLGGENRFLTGPFFLFVFLFSQVLWAHSGSVVQVYLDNSDATICRSASFFHFCGEERHFQRALDWFEKIDQTEIGHATINKIMASSNHLLIINDDRAVNTAGATLSRLTSAISNGTGDDALIKMNFNIPDSGSHLVAALDHSGLIPFTATQNFFHELSHAMHTLRGTMATMREVQAIEETNIFRAQSDPSGQAILRDYRNREDDQQVWFHEDQGHDHQSVRTFYVR